MNLIEILKQCAEKYPRDAAIVDLSRGRKEQCTLTFRELDQHSAHVAGMLQRSGLIPNDRALLLQPMSAGLYISLLGVLRAGLTAMFIDPSAGMTAFRTQCRRYPPAALIATPKAYLLQIVSREIRAIPRKFTLGTAFPGAQSLAFPDKYSEPLTEPIPRDHADPALLTFTSGSTGTPKPAARTHGFVHAQYLALRDNILLSPGEIDLTTLPLFLLANLAAGVTSVIPNVNLRAPGKVAPEIIVANICEHSVTRSAASPALFERLADHCLAKGISLPTLQKIFTGGAPVFPRVLEKLQKVAPNARVFAVYGSTEAEPIAHIEFSQLKKADVQKMYSGRGLLAGNPVPEISVRVLTSRWKEKVGSLSHGDFNRCTLGPNKPGEIVVAGAHVLPSYLDGMDDSETKLHVEGTVWHRTGDTGYLDSGGRLWLLGRCKAEIRQTTKTLYPLAVECAASQFPFVGRSALMEDKGRSILAVEGQGKRRDLESLKQALTWAAIDSVQRVRRIPVDARHNAKVDYTKLRSKTTRPAIDRKSK